MCQWPVKTLFGNCEVTGLGFNTFINLAFKKHQFFKTKLKCVLISPTDLLQIIVLILLN